MALDSAVAQQKPVFGPDLITDLRRDLEKEVDGEVRFDSGSCAAYSTDASNFREVPIGVVVPFTVEDGARAIAVCRKHEVPVLSRGGGTSLAGQCTNTAIVIDWTKYCNRLLSVDTENRTCVVEPGIVLDDLNRLLADTGLRFGPEPSTHRSCTIGGMIGNNSCGATAQRTGKVVDNIASLEVLTYDGTRFWCGETTDDEYQEIERHGDKKATIYRSLRRIRDQYADEIREQYPDIPRRVSGYNIDSLLPEHNFDVAGALVGSESTLVTVLHAELELVPVLPARSLVVLGFDNIEKAAEATSTILKHDPIALEGVDHYLIHDEQVKAMNATALKELPAGRGYLFIQFGAQTADEAKKAGQAMIDEVSQLPNAPYAASFEDPGREDELWAVRESGLGATAHIPGSPDTFPGWEDSAVHPKDLASYIRDLRKMYDEFGYSSEAGPSMYGHFGQGCLHTRIPFDLLSESGVAKYREFMERAADLVVSYGGSLSGEHGDGKNRGELLPKMFGEHIMRAFAEFKEVLDPQNMMNPGKIIHPDRLDETLRYGATWAPKAPTELFFSYPEDNGSFLQAASRCVGVGNCRSSSTEGHQVMCPSYQVTGEEEHSTRGRARLLFEMMNGHGDGPITDGWRSTEVRDALDLCLACKGCKTDCPADVDMATYKAEFLAHHYEGRLRPRADYALGWLPSMGRIVEKLRAPKLVNTLSHAPILRDLAPILAGLERREIPLFASETLQQWWARRGPRGTGQRGKVLIWPDTFTNRFHPQVGKAAVLVLEQAGWQVTMPTASLCCGLTWISTGQLKKARSELTETVQYLADHVRSGGYVVGLEPSCTAVFRSDGPDLLADDKDMERLSSQTVTLAELLLHKTPGWQPPKINTDREINAIAQVHCHQHAIMGWDADKELLQAAGVPTEQLDSGCCGLAGNFGFTKGHGEVSEACAERVLLPRVRSASPDTMVLADGFSCRTQISELDSGGRKALHLAQVLAAAVDEETLETNEPLEAHLSAQTTTTPSAPLRYLAVAGVGAATVAVGFGVWRGLQRMWR